MLTTSYDRVPPRSTHPHSFLDSIDRITSRSYSPTDRDIVRTRLRTIGVQEHHLALERDTAPLPEDKDRRKSKEGSAWSKENREWVIYDVGGSRTSVRLCAYHSCLSLMSTICREMRGYRTSRTLLRSYFSHRSRVSTRCSWKTRKLIV